MLDIQSLLATHQPKNGRFFTIAMDGRDLKVWKQQEDNYIRDFTPEKKADIVINGAKPFEGQL